MVMVAWAFCNFWLSDPLELDINTGIDGYV
jgi:hypothetical protein